MSKKNNPYNRLFLLAAAACASMLVSCANNMALNKSADPGKDAIVLMTVNAHHRLSSNSQIPDKLSFGAGFSQASVDNDVFGSIWSEPQIITDDGVCRTLTCLVSMKVKAGPHTLRHIVLESPKTGIIFDLPFDAKPGHVTYLGSIEAGPSFDATIRDNYGTDMNKFRARYPALQSVKVDKQVLPACRRQFKTSLFE